MNRFARWRRAPSGAPVAGAVGAPRGRRAARLLPPAATWQVSEAELHAYIDDALRPLERMEVEAFLAAHPLVAERVEAYRSQLIAVNAAFKAGESALPPALAASAGRLARAGRSSALVGAVVGIAGLIAMLCAMAGAALGAHG